jgi:Holliday junction DNA helicase RuvA
MIDALTGVLVSKQPHRVVVETGGVAFEVLIPFSTGPKLPPEGGRIRIFTHLHWREDGPQLFGFADEEDRQVFRLLTQVNKVGPKLAVNILSAASPQKIVEMIVTEDATGLTGLKGVGAKLASRLIVELKDAVLKAGFSFTLTADTAAGPRGRIPHEKDIREALANLGYSGREIDKAVNQVQPEISPNADLQEVLEIVLRFFS